MVVYHGVFFVYETSINGFNRIILIAKIIDGVVLGFDLEVSTSQCLSRIELLPFNLNSRIQL